MAAASIGQVHEAVTIDGKKVAMKIQYPGVRASIDSDMNNFLRLITVLNIFPWGLFLKELIENTWAELHTECDYMNEALMLNTKWEFLEAWKFENDYYVPSTVDHLCTPNILTQEFIYGLPIDEVAVLPQETRDWVGTLLLKICLYELFIFKFMQTDPNPANFYYCNNTGWLNLIDYGSARHFDDKFVENYFEIVDGSFTNDKERIH